MSATFICASAASGSVGEEGDEVLVLGFGLGERRGAALLEPAVAHGQLGAHPVLGLGIGVEHGLQVEPGHVEAALLHGDHGLVEEFLVGLLGVDAGQRVGAQVLVLLLLGLLVGLGRNSAQHQNRQSYRGNLFVNRFIATSLRLQPVDWPQAHFPILKILLCHTIALLSGLIRPQPCEPPPAARAHPAPAALRRKRRCRPPAAPLLLGRLAATVS